MSAAVAPHRFYANNRNLLLAAALSVSSVKSVTQNVIEEQQTNAGTAQVRLTGDYTGHEEAKYEIEIVSNIVDVNLISVPIFSGVGTGRMTDISAEGDAQVYTVELFSEGTKETKASINFENVRLQARQVTGNDISLTVDQSTLVFTDTIYSLVVDLQAGAGGVNTGLDNQAFDWDTKVQDSANVIPVDAHRVAFGDDHSAVYLAYKRYDAPNARWLYHFVPEIKRFIPRGTAVKFVTGGRTVSVNATVATVPDTPVDVFEEIITVYDFLNAVKTQSTLIDVVDGVVANDRTPTGQAAREFSLRTDARVEPSSGGRFGELVDTFCAPDAPTELITITCYAISAKDSPTAHLGHEQWQVAGSLSGIVGTAYTGVPFVHPDGRWGFTIQRKLPSGYGAPRGRFSVSSINFPRSDEESKPPVCIENMVLGPNAVDQTITLRWTKRPTGECGCVGMPVDQIDENCLGVFVEGESMSDYSTENRERLIDLYTWAADTVRAYSRYSFGYPVQSPFISRPNWYGINNEAGVVTTDGSVVIAFFAKTLFEVVADWERVLKQINDLSAGSPEGVLRSAAEDAWDTAVQEFETDVDGRSAQSESLYAFENLTNGDAVGVFTDSDGQRKIRKAVPGLERYGFVIEDWVAGSPPAEIFYYGSLSVPGISPPPFTTSSTHSADKNNPGAWTSVADDFIGGNNTLGGIASNDFTLVFSAGAVMTNVYYALLSDRYKMRQNQVLMTGGISPLGKSDADIIVSGDDCWRDWGGSFYWEVVGSDKGKYAPAFNNHVYISSRLAVDGKAYYSTKEFAFQINIACPERLKEGDEITLSIGDAGWPPTYQIGDEYTMPVVSAQPQRFAGGQVGNSIKTWYVSGSETGPLPSFEQTPGDSPSTYTSDLLSFTLTEGGVKFAKGDKWTLTVEGGSWRYRRTIGGSVGAWSTEMAIPAGPTVFVDGLTIEFITGAAPSFQAGDLFVLRALQPWAASNMLTPNVDPWKWEDATASAVFDLLEEKTFNSLVIGWHRLPEGATVTVEGGVAEGVYDWSEELTWRAGVMLAEFDDKTARYVRVTVDNAADGGISWLHLGPAFTTHHGVDFDLKRQYRVGRGDVGTFQGGMFIGKAIGGQVLWTEGVLSEAEIAELESMLDWVKEQGDEPVIFVPNITRPQRAMIARIMDDEIPIDDLHKWGLNADVSMDRQYATTLQLAGVLQ